MNRRDVPVIDDGGGATRDMVFVREANWLLINTLPVRLPRRFDLQDSRMADSDRTGCSLIDDYPQNLLS